MTTLAEPTSLSSKESLAGDQWAQLAPAELPPDLAPATSRPDAPEPGTCATCGDVIIREPGARGRTPKYHPDCRPTSKSLSTSSGGSASGRSTKVDKEAAEALAGFEGMVVKAAMMLSMVDKYDAFVVMVGWQQVKPNLLAVLKKYPGFRKEVLTWKDGGSIAGLVIAILMIILPIAAHHGIIPSSTVAKVLLNAPMTLHKIQQKLAEGTAGLTKLMEEQLAETKKVAEEAKERAAANGAAIVTEHR